MKAAVNTIESLLDRPGIRDVAVNEVDLAGQVLAVAAGKIIENPHRMPLVQQRVYEMRADEPGTAGHEEASHPRSLRQLRKSGSTNSRTDPPRLLAPDG